MAHPSSGYMRDIRQDLFEAVAWGPSSLDGPTEIWGPFILFLLFMSTVDKVHEQQITMSLWAALGWTSWERESGSTLPLPIQ